jgi:hypothetical protein
VPASDARDPLHRLRAKLDSSGRNPLLDGLSPIDLRPHDPKYDPLHGLRQRLDQQSAFDGLSAVDGGQETSKPQLFMQASAPVSNGYDGNQPPGLYPSLSMPIGLPSAPEEEGSDVAFLFFLFWNLLSRFEG